MILKDLHEAQNRLAIMSARRNNYSNIQTLVIQRKFDQINMKQINKEKDFVIHNLHNCQNQQLMDDFSQLSFYQQKYMVLSRFMSVWVDKMQKKEKMDEGEIKKIIEIFQEKFQSEKDDQRPLVNPKTLFKQTDSFPLFGRQTQQPNIMVQIKSPTINSSKKLNNAGLGAAIFQFFDKKQRQSKTVGFKDLLQKRVYTSQSKPFAKKAKKPNHDIQIKKLLQQNKRLHSQLQKRGKQQTQLNQFQKGVLRQQKQRCMKRIEQLQQQVQQLARNNYKLQQIQKQRSKKSGITTFVNQDSIQNSKNQLLPYYIQTRKNDLQVITQKNKLTKSQNQQKDNLLLKLVNQIPPIQKKQQYSFDYDAPYQNKVNLPNYNNYNNNMNMNMNNNNNNILQGLLQDNQQNPRIQNYVGKQNMNTNTNTNQKLQRNMQMNYKQSNKYPQNNLLFNQGQEVNYNQGSKISRNFANQSLQNGNRFQSFSMAQTAYNNSSLFLNASKNQVAIDSITSTRNKVAFFKNSLVIYRDDKIQIAYKKSNLDSNYSQIRLIFYINNKTDQNLTVRTQYDYQTTYYNLRVTQRLMFIKPNEQARQVIQISLMPNCSDLNSVIDVHFIIGQKNYDLWMPVCFIQWVPDNLIQTGQMGFMTVQPDRQFCSYQTLGKLVPLGRKIKPSTDQVQTFLFGRSRFGNHQIKLTWWQKQLTIDANNKILDFLGFIMHHFK